MRKLLIYTSIPLLILLVAFLAAWPPSGARAVNFGTEAIEGSTGILSNNILCQVATAPSSGDIESITAYIDASGGGQVAKYALYNAGTGALLGQTVEIGVPTTPAWTTATFASPVAVSASTSYYICAWADGSFAVTINRASASVAGRFRGLTYTTAFPDPDGTSNNNFRYSIYATYQAPAPSDTCTYGGTGDWFVDLADSCYITDDVWVSGGLYCYGSGSFTIASGAEVRATALTCSPAVEGSLIIQS